MVALEKCHSTEGLLKFDMFLDPGSLVATVCVLGMPFDIPLLALHQCYVYTAIGHSEDNEDHS